MSPEVSAPELAPLRDAGYPLEPLSLPNVRVEGGSVFYSAMTPDSTNSKDYQDAFAKLRAAGCEVAVDQEAAENFVGVKVTVPEGLLSPQAVMEICRAIAAKAEAEINKMTPANFDPNEGAAGC